MFQFHNGTINTLPYDREANIPDVFQFHNGTINTTRIVRPAKPIACFNSTTVQLIQLMEQQQQYNKERFNSTTVQLIRLRCIVFLRLFLCFNSTTVQLIPFFSLILS